METAVTNRRRHERVTPETTTWRELRLRTGDKLAIVDIGDGGALVESTRRLMPGALVAVNLVGEDYAVTVEARIVRCTVCEIGRSGGVRYRGALAFTVETPRPDQGTAFAAE